MTDSTREYPQLTEKYLVLERDGSSEQSHRKLRLCSSLKEVVRHWDASSRVSPVFVPAGPRRGKAYWEERWMIFLSMVHPVALKARLKIDAEFWYTVGAFNVVVVGQGSDLSSKVLAAAEELLIPWEMWQVHGGAVTSKWSKGPSGPEPWRELLVEGADLTPPGPLRDAHSEYIPLLASALTRSDRVARRITSDLAVSAEFLLGEMANADSKQHRVYETLGLLRTTNAGLSRFTSQAYSGISPIADTECHYWVHSLLGTGMANLALWNVVKFVLEIFGTARLPERLELLQTPAKVLPRGALLREVDPHAMTKLDAHHQIWHTDHLSQVTIPPPSDDDKVLPLVAHFSGRDGYMSSVTTISAPLAVMASCNSRRYSLLTLTHELSHVVLRGIFSVILPWDDDEPGFTYDDAEDLIRRKARNPLEAIQRWVLNSLIPLDAVAASPREDEVEGPDPSAAELRRLVMTWNEEAQEICAHAFDFLYFYNADPTRYVQSIWHSWSTLPDLGSRVEEYTIRTVCAVHARHLSQEAGAMDLTRAAVAKELDGLPRLGPGAKEFAQARALVGVNWEQISESVIDRLSFVQLVNGFIFSKQLRALLKREPQRQWAVEMNAEDELGIGRESITNPLDYIEQMTKGREPSAVASLRILSMLAFNVE